MIILGLPRLIMSRSLSKQQDLSRAVFRFFSAEPSCRKSPSALFRFNWVTITDRIENNVFFDPIGDWIEKMLPVISSNWAPGEAGNISGQILEKTLSHSQARKTNFQHFRGKSSCERTERYFFNGLQIQLHNNCFVMLFF